MVNVQAKLIEGMKLPPKELELLHKYTKGELTEEQALKIIKNLIAQFVKTNGEEKMKEALHDEQEPDN